MSRTSYDIHIQCTRNYCLNPTSNIECLLTYAVDKDKEASVKVLNDAGAAVDFGNTVSAGVM